MQDEELRESLEKDFSEIEKAYQNESWKSVHVLAGSIVEALLLETITSINKLANREALLKKALGELISEAVTLGILSEKEEKLTTVLKDYRNLIHPGRVLRLQERVSSDSASICLSLVRIIASKLEVEQGEKIGYTAENIINKMRSDGGFPAIIDSLLGKTTPREKFKLVAEHISKAINTELEERPFHGNAHEYSKVYRDVIADFDDRQIRQLEAIWVREVESKDESGLEVYFTHLFHIDMVQRFSVPSRDVILRYAFNKYKRYSSVDLDIFQGFTKLPEYMAAELMNVIFHRAIYLIDSNRIKKASRFVEREEFMYNTTLLIYRHMESEYKNWLEFLEDGIKEGKDWQGYKTRLNEFHDSVRVLPF